MIRPVWHFPRFSSFGWGWYNILFWVWLVIWCLVLGVICSVGEMVFWFGFGVLVVECLIWVSWWFWFTSLACMVVVFRWLLRLLLVLVV